MIKITKNPNPQCCSRCGCEFTYESEDISFKYDRDTLKEYAYIKCPVCNKEIEL